MADLTKGKRVSHKSQNKIKCGTKNDEINVGGGEGSARLKEPKRKVEKKLKHSPNKESTNSEKSRPKSAKVKVKTVKTNLETEQTLNKDKPDFPSKNLSSEKKVFEKVRKDIWVPADPKSLADKIRQTETFIRNTRSILENEPAAKINFALIRKDKTVVPVIENQLPIEQAMINKIKKEVNKPHLLIKKQAMANEDSIKCIFDRNRQLLCPSKMVFSHENINKLFEQTNDNTIITENDQLSDNDGTQEIEENLESLSNKNTEQEIRVAKTSLSKKSKREKERILKIMAKAGLPLPLGKSTSEKKMIEKVRKDIGLPQIEEKRVKTANSKGTRNIVLFPLLEKRVPSQNAMEKAVIKKVKQEKSPSKVVTVPPSEIKTEKTKEKKTAIYQNK